MSEPRDDVRTLQSRSKAELKRLLTNELGSSYQRSIPSSLRNDFLRACYERIDPEQDPLNRARGYPEYNDSWREKRTLATALRMLLDAIGVRNQQSPLTQLDKPALAQIIVAIRLADEGRAPTESASTPIDSPTRTAPSQQRFNDILMLDEATEEDVQAWVEERRPGSQWTHCVYVIDCTPPIDAESTSLKQLRAQAEETQEEGNSLDQLEQAAASLTDGERVYYIGYTNDVVDRVARHRGGASYGGGTFTNTFHPQALVDVSWFETEQEAREMEGQIADELTEDGRWFGYWA